MASLLVKDISRLSPFSQHRSPAVLTPLLRFLLSTQSQQSKEEMPFIAQYLISSFGFSPDRARRVSISCRLAAIKSPDRPDKVASYLREIGLSDLQIRNLISFDPALLNSSVDSTLKPQTLALVEAGFTGQMLIQLIQSNPRCLYRKTIPLHLQFWRKFVGNSNEVLLNFIKRSSFLITCDIDKNIMPKISLLREYGLSDQQIVRLITCKVRFMSRNIDIFRWVLKQTEDLGILRESNMYPHGLQAVCGLTKEALAKKLDFVNKMYGWSIEEFCSAFRKCPSFISYSEEGISSKMDFLINIVGIEPRIMASQSKLLSYSMEKTLIPRHNILSALKTKGLIKKGSLLSACGMTEKQFLERYAVPYEKVLPELANCYATGLARKLLSSENQSSHMYCYCASHMESQISPLVLSFRHPGQPVILVGRIS